MILISFFISYFSTPIGNFYHSSHGLILRSLLSTSFSDSVYLIDSLWTSFKASITLELEITSGRVGYWYDDFGEILWWFCCRVSIIYRKKTTGIYGGRWGIMSLYSINLLFSFEFFIFFTLLQTCLRNQILLKNQINLWLRFVRVKSEKVRWRWME